MKKQIKVLDPRVIENVVGGVKMATVNYLNQSAAMNSIKVPSASATAFAQLRLVP